MTLDTLGVVLLALLTTQPHTAGAWKAEWLRLNPAQRIQPRRSGFVSFADAAQNVPYVFGGYAEVETQGDGGDFRRYTTNDVWKWEDAQWQPVATTGRAPAPRLVGAAAVLGTTAYLIGGWNSDASNPADILLDTVHALDLSTSKPSWRLLDAKIPDGTASRHVVVALADDATLLLHHHRCVDFVWLFDGQDFRKQPTTGTCPSPRGLHAACLLADNRRVVVFGGAAQDQTMSNQVYVLDTQDWEWTELVPHNDENNSSSNVAPCPRAAPCMCPLDEDHVLLFGGAEATASGLQGHNDLWVFQLSTRQWTCLEPVDAEGLPPPRNAAALFRTTSSRSSSAVDFLLTNGWAPFQVTHDDCYRLRVTQA
jgi:hypothetical protein